MPLKVVTSSLDLPVAIATALRHLRVLDNEIDLVKLYLQAASEAVEDYTGRALITKTYCLQLDSWPNYRSFWPTFRSYVPTEVHPLWGSDNLRCIELRRTPLISIDSVKYYDPNNLDGNGLATLTTLATTHYRADTASEPGRIVFIEDGFTLPDVEKRVDAVQIQFQAGYGTKESNIDPMLRLAVLQFAHNFYDNRVPLGDAKLAAIPYNLQHLLRAKRVESLAPVK